MLGADHQQEQGSKKSKPQEEQQLALEVHDPHPARADDSVLPLGRRIGLSLAGKEELASGAVRRGGAYSPVVDKKLMIMITKSWAGYINRRVAIGA